MASKHSKANENHGDASSEYMRGGRGRKDEVKGSGIYPALSPNAPADADVRNVGELVHHKGPKQKAKFKRAI